MSAAKPSVLEARNIRRVFRRGPEEVAAVDGVSLAVEAGDFVAVVGPSGSGKTTLLNVIGCLDNPTSGSLFLDGKPVFEEGKMLSEGALTRIRREAFGYVFQKFYLVPTLTVVENVVLPFTFYRKPGAGDDVDRILKLLEIDHRRDHRPGELSGGEMQRVAVARALVNRPRILLADEPTGNLDTRRSLEIGHLLRDLNEREGLTVILVTHNLLLAATARRIVEIRDGRVAPASPSPA